MITELCREKIYNYDDNNARYRLANNELYDLVSRYPQNLNQDEIVAKLWIIGRTYAAAVERRPNKEATPGDFYYDHIAPAIAESELNDKINHLRSYTEITVEIIPEILEAHNYLMAIFKEKTEKEKRSLASKYLHFHLPNLFFIYDSRVASVITKFSGRTPRGIIIPENADETYAKYFFKAYEIYSALPNDQPYTDCKPRVIDNILLRYCDENNIDDQAED